MNEKIERWIAESGLSAFTVADLQRGASELFPQDPPQRRMMYSLVQQYVSITGVVPERRMRGNFNAQVFTPQQAAQILSGFLGWKVDQRRYVESFEEIRAAARGEVYVPSSHLPVTRAYVSEQLWKLFLLLRVIPKGEIEEIERYAPVVQRFLGVQDVGDSLAELDELLGNELLVERLE